MQINLPKRRTIMAQPLGPKSILIREAITANPDKGNTELAAFLNDADDRKTDKIKVTAQDVASQKQAMKKAGVNLPVATHPKKRGRKPGSVNAAKPVAAVARASSPIDLIDRTFALAQECGGIDQLKRLVDRLAGV
jgi:hypothetical protein